MDMDRPTALDLLDYARRAREEVAEFVPMLSYQTKWTPVVALIERADGETMEDAISRILDQMHEAFGPPEWIAFVADVFAANDGHGKMTAAELAKAFASGDPDVYEQMIVTVVDREGSAETVAQTYRTTSSDGWEWDKPVPARTPTDAVMAAMLDYIR